MDRTSSIPFDSGHRRARTKGIPGWLLALIIFVSVPLAMVISYVLFLTLLWIWLAYSLMPRPWQQAPSTPLPAIHAAAEAGDIAGIQQCMQAGDTIDLQAFGNPKWTDGTTPLMIAAFNGDAATTEAILNLGARIDLADIHGDGPIHRAAPGSLEVLLKHGANVNARTRHGQTPLMRAAIRARYTKDVRPIQLLLNAGADVKARDNQGRTAIGVLRTWSDPDPEVIRMIEEAGGK